MKNKLIAAVLSTALVCASAFALSGCGSVNYPVSVANIKIDKEPENIVILDPSAADVISYMGYDVKMVGRSDEVDQKSMSIVPSVGSAANPSVESIVNSLTDTVFADSTLDKNIRSELESKGIEVITLSVAQSQKQLETCYETAGKILGGNEAGLKKAKDSIKDLYDTMNKMKDEATAESNLEVLSTACYLYSENGTVRATSSGSYGDLLLGYTGVVNVAVNNETDDINADTLKIANPEFIFYDSELTLNIIKADETLSKLAAVKGGKMLEISSEEMSRQGYTAIETLQKMIDFTHGNTQTSAAVETAASEETTVQPATTVADKYKLKLTDKLSLKIEDENGNVKIMQQRLYDLGYVDDKENITGYFGTISEQAVKDFQKKNGLEQTGAADNKTLKAMFSESAVKAGDDAEATTEPEE